MYLRYSASFQPYAAPQRFNFRRKSLASSWFCQENVDESRNGTLLLVVASMSLITSSMSTSFYIPSESELTGTSSVWSNFPNLCPRRAALFTCSASSACWISVLNQVSEFVEILNVEEHLSLGSGMGKRTKSSCSSKVPEVLSSLCYLKVKSD